MHLLLPIIATFVLVMPKANGRALERAQHVRAAVVTIPCMCSFPECSCCAQLTPDDNNSVQVACADLIFNPDDIGVRLQLKVAGRTLLDREVSAANPPPACISPPMVPFVAFCAQLYDLRVDSDVTNVCLKLDFQLFGSDAVELNLQCIHLEDGMLTAQPAGR